MLTVAASAWENGHREEKGSPSIQPRAEDVVVAAASPGRRAGRGPGCPAVPAFERSCARLADACGARGCLRPARREASRLRRRGRPRPRRARTPPARARAGPRASHAAAVVWLVSIIEARPAATDRPPFDLVWASPCTESSPPPGRQPELEPSSQTPAPMVTARLRFDYTTVGHVTADVLGDGSRRPGGSAFYSALQAARLGQRDADPDAGRAARDRGAARSPTARSSSSRCWRPRRPPRWQTSAPARALPARAGVGGRDRRGPAHRHLDPASGAHRPRDARPLAGVRRLRRADPAGTPQSLVGRGRRDRAPPRPRSAASRDAARRSC